MAQYHVEQCPACKAEVVWALTTSSATWMPLDAEASPAGTMALEAGWDGHPRTHKTSAKLAFGRRTLRTPHATTCVRSKSLREYHYSPPAR